MRCDSPLRTAVLALLGALILQPLVAVAPVWAQQADRSRAIFLRLESGVVGRPATALRATRPAAHTVKVLRQQSHPEPAPRQRHPQLSEDHLVVIAVDRAGEEISRIVILDPRLVRAETIDPQGRFVSRRLYRQQVEFSVTLPDDDRVVRLRLLHPRWTGTEFVLEPLGEARTR